jgi:transmembrane sensor
MSDIRPELNDPIAQESIEWLVLLKSGAATSEDVSAFEGWRSSDPRHDAAIRRIEMTLGLFELAGDTRTATRAALLLPSAGRRHALGRLIALSGLVLGVGVLARRTLPFKEFTADLRTSVAERRRMLLADGHWITLNARAAANVAKGQNGGAIVQLIIGDLFVEMNPQAVLALTVHTREGVFSAVRGKFAVRQDDGFSRLYALTADVAVKCGNEGQSTACAAGQSAEVGAQGITLLSRLSPYAETAWLDGKIQVNDRPLSEVVAALEKYRVGFIRLSPQAAALRVSGLFPLDDTDSILQTLAQTLPVIIRQTTPYFVTIEAAPKGLMQSA